MTITVDKITEDVLNEFGGRKVKGRIDFVADVTTGEIYPVPKEIEHSEFVPKLPSYSPRTSRYVPLQFRLENGGVREVLVGASSYEAEHKVEHSPEEIAKARAIAWTFLVNSDLSVNLEREDFYKAR